MITSVLLLGKTTRRPPSYLIAMDEWICPGSTVPLSRARSLLEDRRSSLGARLRHEALNMACPPPMVKQFLRGFSYSMALVIARLVSTFW